MELFTNKKQNKQMLILLGIIVIILIGFLVYRNFTFHVVNTDPPINNFSNVALVFDINFNEELSSNNIYITSSPNIIQSYDVSGKALDITLKNTPLTIGDQYTLTIRTIYSISGKVITNKRFVFVPKLVPANQLSTAQQNAQLQQQAAGSKNQPPTYSGTQALLNNGISVEQIQDFEQAVSNFAQNNNIKFSTVEIDQNSVSPEPLNTYSDGSIGYGFSLQIGNGSYTAKLHCINVTQADLVLDNPQNNSQVFDSGIIGSNNPQP